MSASRRPRMSTLREGRLESGTDTIKGVHNSFSACFAVCFFLSLFLMCLPSRNFLGMLPVSMKPYHGHATVEWLLLGQLRSLRHLYFRAATYSPGHLVTVPYDVVPECAVIRRAQQYGKKVLGERGEDEERGIQFSELQQTFCRTLARPSSRLISQRESSARRARIRSFTHARRQNSCILH